MCGIVGIYSLEGGSIDFSIVLRGLLAMRERGTPHGAGVAYYRGDGRLLVKAFSRTPVGRYVKIADGFYDVTLENEHLDDGFVYLKSRWLDVYKVADWPEGLAARYKLDGVRSPVWLGHTRYPTNSPGRLPLYSHPFAVGEVAIVHNGDLSSYGSHVELINHYVGDGKFTGNDSESIAHLLNYLLQTYDVEEAIRELLYGQRVRWARLDGPYAVAFMVGGPSPYFGAFVDLYHFRPLYVGTDGTTLYVASEAAAIKAMSPSARVWALRGGEYIVAHKGEVWGNFKMRYVYPQSPPPPAEGFIDASAFGVTELADVIRREVEKRGQVSVVNVNGHRYLASGLERGVVKMWGVVGNASANVMSGGEVYVYGDVQDDFGDAMNGGVAVVYGNAGDTLGQAKRGGEIYVYGDVGTRAAIQHRGGVVIIGGSAGDFLGEYMGGGTVVVLRVTNDEPVGKYIGSGLVGGKIYIRGDDVPPDFVGLAPSSRRLKRYVEYLYRSGRIGEEEYRRLSLGDFAAAPSHLHKLWGGSLRVERRHLTEEEVRELAPYVAKFNTLFGLNVDISKEVFTVVSRGHDF